MRDNPRISVFMATFNGAKNLAAQLDSLKSQKDLPAELVVCDDISSDQTISILNEFSKNAPFPMFIHQNQQRLGPAENFFRAAALCKQPYVAFCDQDDIWRPDKIGQCSRAISKHSPDLVLHRYTTFHIDEYGSFQYNSERPPLPEMVLPGTSMDPERVWLGMSMVAHRTLIERASQLAGLWRAHCAQFDDPDERLFYYNWGDCHDLAVLVAVREGGKAVLINRFLADHRTMDGGLFSDPVRGQQQALNPLPRITPVRGDKDKYWRLALFCQRMALFLEKADGHPQAIAHYRRWEELARLRGDLRNRATSPLTRLQAGPKLAAIGAYRNAWSGGEGRHGLKDDVLALLRPLSAA